ncbi:MAG: hypothetical protein U0800_14305 [Isosphaeraceae bacterium]
MSIEGLAAIVALLGPAVNASALDDAPSKASVAARFKAIAAEYEAEQKAANEAGDAAPNESLGRKILSRMSPDDAAYSRRMVELAKSSPADPSSRDALVVGRRTAWRWTLAIQRPGRRVLVDQRCADDPGTRWPSRWHVPPARGHWWRLRRGQIT